MPRKRRARRMRGGSVLSKIKSAVGKVNNYLKRTKAVSKVAGVLDSVGVPYSGAVAKYAGMAGYGKRRRRRRRY